MVYDAHPKNIKQLRLLPGTAEHLTFYSKQIPRHFDITDDITASQAVVYRVLEQLMLPMIQTQTTNKSSIRKTETSSDHADRAISCIRVYQV